jgi:hypothetical protein
MVALLKDVRAAWAALTEAPLRQDNEWLGVPGSRSNFQIFPESTRIVCLLRCHCARWSARTNEQVQTPRDFSGQAESGEHQPCVPSSQKQPSVYTLQLRRWYDFARPIFQAMPHVGKGQRGPCNRPETGHSKSSLSPRQHRGPTCPNVRGCLTTSGPLYGSLLLRAY